MKVCASAGWYEYRSVYIHATSGIRTYGPSIRGVKDGRRYRAFRCDQYNNIIVSSVYSNNTEKEEGKKQRNRNMQYGSATFRLCGRVGWGNKECIRNFRGSGPFRNRTVGIRVRRTEAKAKAKENRALYLLVGGELNWLRIIYTYVVH
jgi:hypothetical protein